MSYVFDNAAPQAPDRLAALADVYDGGTIRHLVALGVGDGWQCLEVGGGLGTVTRWLADRVGERGRVLTTDIDTRFLEVIERNNVEVRRHDVTKDPLPESMFDIAFARLVLEHLGNPDVALDRMLMAVRPGGWLMIEDFEVDSTGPQSKTMRALRRVTAGAGADAQLGVSLGRRLRARGLVDVGHEGRLYLCRGRTTAARLARLNFEQLREPILASGVTIDEFEADLARLDDANFEWRSPTLWTAWGRRPQLTT